MSRWIAWLFSLLLTLVLVISGLLGFLLLTTEGARWLADWALELEPRLSLNVDSGAIAGGLKVSDVRWEDEGITVAVANAELNWNPGCLLATTICLDKVAVSGLRVVVQAQANEEPKQPAPPPADIHLPIKIRVQLLQLSDAQVSLSDTEISLRSLQSSARFSGKTLTVNWLRAAGLDVALTPADDAAAEAGAEVPAEQLHTQQLPEIDLPLDLVVRNLLLEEVGLRLAENHFVLQELATSATLRGPQLDLRQFDLQAEGLAAALSGRLRLAQAYPLSLRLEARVSPSGLPAPLQVLSQVNGDLEQLAFTLNSSGPLSINAEGSLQPLQPALPFRLAAHWEQLAYPFSGEAAVALRNGNLEVSGDLAFYEGRLESMLSGAQVPAGRWQIQFAGSSEQLKIAQLTAATLGGALQAQGELNWREGLQWQARLQAQNLNPANHWPEFPGALSGELQAQGEVVAGTWSLVAETSGIKGSLRGYPLALQGGVSKQLDELWQFDDIRLVSGGNRIRVHGRLQERWALQGEFDLPQPESLLPELQGAVNGQLAVRGAMLEPDVELQLQGSGLRYQDNRLDDIQLQLDVRQLAFGDSSVRWTVRGLHAGEQSLNRLQGELRGTRGEHALTLSVQAKDYGGRLRLSGSLDEQLNWRGVLQSATLRLPPRLQWQLLEPVELAWLQNQQQFHVAAHCWRQQGAQLCLTENVALGEQGGVELALSDFHLSWLSPWLPEGLDLQAPLNGQARFQWQPESPPDLQVTLSSSAGMLILDQADNDPLRLAYQQVQARLRLEQSVLQASLELASEQLGSGLLHVRTELGNESRPLSGEVALNGLQVSVAQAFLPDIQTLEGAVSINGRLGGSLEDPQFHGSARLENGEVMAANLPMVLTDIQLRAEITGNEAHLSGGFQSGEGGATLSGQAVWGGESWQLDLGIQGEQLQVAYEQIARLRVSPNLTLRIQPQQVSVEGQVVVPRGQITLKKLPEGAVAVSDDVVVINREEPANGVAPQPAAGWAVILDIELLLGDAVKIEGFGLEGQLAGDLRLRQRPQGVPEATGELRIVDGRYEAYGQKLEIRQGQLLFSGPLKEPNINVEAVRRVDNVVAGLRVEGEPEQPQVTLFSEPGLPQEEILSYLIRGRPLGAEGSGGDQLLAQAALSLGVFGGKGFATSLASELGVEDFEVGTAGEGEDTQVELSGYLTPDLMVRYGIGVFEPVNTLTLRYRINKNFFVEAVSGLESALDFFYEFEF